MPWEPLPTGQGANPLLKRLKAMDAEIYGAIFAKSGTIDGPFTISGDLTVSGSTTISGDTSMSGDLTLSGGSIATNVAGNARAILSDNSLAWYDSSNTLRGKISVLLWDGVNRMAINNPLLQTPLIDGWMTFENAAGGITLTADTSETVTADGAIYANYSGATGNYHVWRAPNTAAWSGYMSAGWLGDSFLFTTGTEPTSGTALLKILRAGGVQVPNELQLGDGSAGDPSMTFINEGGLGWYRHGGGMMSLSIGTSRSFTLTSSGLYLQGTKKIEWDAAGAGVANISEGYGLELNGDTTHPVQILAPTLLGLNAVGGTYTNGYVYHAPPTTGSAANATWTLASGSVYYMQRSTSARKYKTEIDYDFVGLADYELKPNRHWRLDDEKYLFGFIADDLAEQNPEFVTLDDDGEIENYEDRAVLAILAAKVNRLEQRIEELEAK